MPAACVNLVQIGEHCSGSTGPRRTFSFVVRGERGRGCASSSRAALEILSIDHLPPAGDPRRDQGHPRRADLEGSAGTCCWRPAGCGSVAAGALPGPAGNLRDHQGLPRPFRSLEGTARPAGAGGVVEGGRAALGPHPLQLPDPAAARREGTRPMTRDPITPMDLEELGLLTPGGKEDE